MRTLLFTRRFPGGEEQTDQTGDTPLSSPLSIVGGRGGFFFHVLFSLGPETLVLSG